MARYPTIDVPPTALDSTPLPYQRLEVSPAGFGGRDAQALGNFSDVVQQGLDAYRKQQAQPSQQTQTAQLSPHEIVYANAVDRFKLDTQHDLANYAMHRHADAIDRYPDLQQTLQASRDAVLNNIPAPLRPKVQPALDQIHNEALKLGMEHRTRQDHAWSDHSSQASLDVDMQEALLWRNNPLKVQRVIDRAVGEWSKIGERKGWDEQQLGEQISQWNSRLYGTVIGQHLHDGNIQGAHTLLADAQNRLDPASFERVRGQVIDTANRMEAERTAPPPEGERDRNPMRRPMQEQPVNPVLQPRAEQESEQPVDPSIRPRSERSAPMPAGESDRSLRRRLTPEQPGSAAIQPRSEQTPEQPVDPSIRPRWPQNQPAPERDSQQDWERWQRQRIPPYQDINPPLDQDWGDSRKYQLRGPGAAAEQPVDPATRAQDFERWLQKQNYIDPETMRRMMENKRVPGQTTPYQDINPQLDQDWGDSGKYQLQGLDETRQYKFRSARRVPRENDFVISRETIGNLPVAPDDMYKALDFDPSGHGQWGTAIRVPGAITGLWQSIEAQSDLPDILKKYNIPFDERNPGHNDSLDAIRHALWSYRMAKWIGGDAAKAYADAHERSQPNADNERLMDLYNNRIGRMLALDPGNANRDAIEVIVEAYKKGLLRTSLFNVVDS